MIELLLRSPTLLDVRISSVAAAQIVATPFPHPRGLEKSGIAQTSCESEEITVLYYDNL